MYSSVIKFYNYSDSTVTTTVYQAILSLMYHAPSPGKPPLKRAAKPKRPKSAIAGKNAKERPRAKKVLKSKFIRRKATNKSDDRRRVTPGLDKKAGPDETACLRLLMEYPFNQFFINFVCFIRDKLFSYFEVYSASQSRKVVTSKNELRNMRENFLDFDAAMESKISILRDMCNTASDDFNRFMLNVILKCAHERANR